MRLIKKVILLGGIFLLSFCFLEDRVWGKEMNLLKNGGFEADTNRDRIPDKWSVEGKKGFVETDKRIAHDGGHSVKIIADDTPAGVYQFVPHDGKSKLYKLSVWVKTDLVETTKAHIGIDYYSKDKWLREEVGGAGTWRPRMGLLQLTGKTGWKRYVTYFKNIPPQTTGIRVWCKVNAWETPWAKGTAWFDDINVEPIKPNPEYPLGYPPTQWKSEKVPYYSKKVQDSGYIVYPVNHLKYILPDMVPEKGTDILKIKSFSFPSDYLPITFCVHALEDIKDVKIKVSDLIPIGGKGTVISAEDISVRKMCYLYRQIYYQTNEYLLSPAYLEEFDRLTISERKTQQFWLTVKVPEDDVSDRYKGTIQIIPSNAQEKTIKVELQVFPIELLQPKGMLWGMYMYWAGKTEKEKDMFKKWYTDMKEHGMTSAGVFINLGSEVKLVDRKVKIDWNSKKGLAVNLDNYRDCGFTEPVLLYLSDVIKIAEKLGGKLGSKEFEDVYSQIIRGIMEEGKRRDWPEFYLCLPDEGYPYTFPESRIEQTRVLIKIFKKLGVKSATHAINHPLPNTVRYAKEFYPSLDMVLLTFCHPPVCVSNKFPELNTTWKKFIEEAKREGKKILFYNVDNNGLQIEGVRFGYGIGLWLKKAEGMINTCYYVPGRSYQIESYLPFYLPSDKTHKGGPIPAWEAIREGVEDYRLLHTVTTLIKEAENSANREKRRIAKKAKREIEKILSKADMRKIDMSSRCFLWGNWQKQWYGKGDEKYVTGDCKLPTGFDWDDYDKLRLLVCKYITALQNTDSEARRSLGIGWEKIQYHGWNNCYRIQSGGVNLVVVGDVGARVMEYSLNGENILWQNPEYFGLTLGKYSHPGGSQFDLLNEKGDGLSGIDPELWIGQYQIKIITPYHLEAASPIGKKSRIQLVRDIRMDKRTSKVTITQTAINRSDRDITLSIWDRTWTKAPCFLFLPVIVSTKTPEGWLYLSKKDHRWIGLPKEHIPAASEQFKTIGDLLTITPEGNTCQIIIDSHSGWFAYVRDDVVYVKKYPAGKGEFPWAGYPVSIWLSKKEWKEVGMMAEMEPISSLTRLKPGESFSFKQEWYLKRLDKPVTRIDELPSVRNFVDREIIVD